MHPAEMLRWRYADAAALRRSGKTLAELLDGVHLFPQTLINVRVEKGFDWQSHAGLKAARDQIEPELEGRGRVLIRASGTEPVVRVMVEAEQVETAERAAQTLADALRAA